jgi:hypothetical protein
MFGSILPYDKGLKHNIVINPQNIYYRDPKDEIMPRKYIIKVNRMSEKTYHYLKTLLF